VESEYERFGTAEPAVKRSSTKKIRKNDKEPSIAHVNAQKKATNIN
jgi:hypothetical protein